VKIVFAGTPAFAVPALAALIRSHHEVALVITQPDRPAGRGRHAHAPPVKTTAAAHNVPVIQSASVNQPEVIDIISGIAPDAIVVVAYGRKFATRILSLPKLGCFNIHASLLPRYRGAAPIQHAILNGEQQTGVTIQHMAPEIDTGAIVAQQAER